MTPETPLQAIRIIATRARDLDMRIAEMTTELEKLHKQKEQLEARELVDLFDMAETDNHSLTADGNLPAYDFKLKTIYKAVLPKDSVPGLSWLDSNGFGDMAKSVFTVTFDKSQAKAIKAFREIVHDFADIHRMGVEEERTVHWKTLTAFVKEQIENYKRAIPLDLLGAIIIRRVEIKQRKEK